MKVSHIAATALKPAIDGRLQWMDLSSDGIEEGGPAMRS